MRKIIPLTIYLACLTAFCQNVYTKTLWDKNCNCPVQFATISNNEGYSISNEDGLFNFITNDVNAEINMLGYKKLNFKLNEIKNDTIYLKEKAFVLDQVVILSRNTYKDIIKSKDTDYETEPYINHFSLRTIIRKNNEIIKMADLIGKIKQQNVFSSKKNKIAKDDYSVEIDNYRKAYVKNTDYRFSILSNFNNFINNHEDTNLLISKNFNFSYSTLKDSSYTKMNANLKQDIAAIDIKGYYIINNNNKNFEKSSISLSHCNEKYTVIDEDWKFKPLSKNIETFYKKNITTNKLQVNKKIVNFKIENIYKGQKDIIEVSYIYFAEPIDSSTKVKNNVNHDKSFFDFKFKYKNDFWKNQDKLPLTQEMLLFINKIKKSEFNSNYTVKTNIK